MAHTVGKILRNKKLGVGSAIGLAVNTFATISDYRDSRLQGKSKIGAGINAVGNAVIFDAIGLPGVLGYTALKEGPKLISNGIIAINQAARSMDRSARNVPFQNANFVDSKQAYTMRQAGMELARASKYNLQQSLMGNEAASMHRV